MKKRADQGRARLNARQVQLDTASQRFVFPRRGLAHPLALEVIPDELVGVQLGCIPRKEVQLQAAGPITIQAASGSLRLSAGDQILELKPGEVAVLESALEHEVEALEESALLLTLVRTT